MESILASIGLELRELKETMQTISDTLKEINENMKNAPSSATNTEQGNVTD